MAGPGPEVAIVGSDGTTRLYNVPAPTPALSVFLSNQSVAGAGLAPAVIIAPGGGYSHLSIDKEGTDVAARFGTMGVHAFVLKYRVPARPETNPSPSSEPRKQRGLVAKTPDLAPRSPRQR